MKILSVLFLSMSCLAFAEKTGVKVDDISAQNDTSIVIKKGDVQAQCTEYEIVAGTDEVYGSPEYDRAKAYSSWKTACQEWKQQMRELNKENRLLSLQCASPTSSKEGDQFVFKGGGNYKVRVKTKEKP